MKSSAKLHGLPMLVIAACVIAAYHGTLACSFIFDDINNIVERPAIAMTKLDAASVGAVLENSLATNRWAANLSFALNHYIGGFDSMRGWHIVNIAIHLLTGWLVYALGVLTFRRLDHNEDAADRRLGQKSIRWAALAAAVLWVLHPVQIQAVTYIVQRMTSMATMFYLAALCLYIVGRQANSRRRRGVCFTLVPLAWLLALGSKEIAITLPVVIIIYEWFFFQKLSRDWIARGLKFCIVPFAAMIVIGIIFLHDDPWQTLVKGYEFRDFNMAQRVMTEWRVIVFYFSLLLLPLPQRLNLDHHCEVISLSIFTPLSTVFSLLFILGLLAGACAAARRYPLPAFCVLWFFINLALESTVMNLELVFEHRLYLPTVGIMIGIVYGLYRIKAIRRHGYVAAVVVGIVALLFIFWTYQRNLMWSSALMLWEDCAAKSPNKPRPLTNFGYALVQRGEAGDIDEAVRYYHRALEANPNYPLANNNLAKVLTDRGDYAAAIEHCQRAISKKPKYAEAYNNYGVALVKSGNYDGALEKFHTSIKLDPNDASAYRNIGNAHLGHGDLDQADQYYRYALTLQPDSANAWNGRGGVQKKRGRHQDALPLFRKALALDPAHKPSRANCRDTLAILGSIELKAGRIKAAAAYFSEAIDMLPNAKDCNNLGACLGQLGQLDDAIAMFARAVELDPDYVDARRNLEAAEQMKQQQERP